MEDESDQDARTVFCANVAPNATEEIIYELFLQAGPVERVKIPQTNGRPANYAFITFKHVCSVEYAIEIFRDTELYGMYLRLKKRNTKNQENNSNYKNKNDKNENMHGYHAVLNNMVRMSNMYNMMPQGYPQDNAYLGSNCYMQPHQRSPPRNRYQSDQRPAPHTPSGRYDSRSSHRRYDEHKPRHNDRRDRKRHKRNYV